MLDLKIPKEKKNQKQAKNSNIYPNGHLESEVVDPDYWKKFCSEYKDLFEEPGTPVERDIKHQIDLLNPDAPVKYHKQYRMSQQELDECNR